MGRMSIRYLLLRLVNALEERLVLRRFFLEAGAFGVLHLPFSFLQFKAALEGSGAYLEYVPAIFSINPTGPSLGLLS